MARPRKVIDWDTVDKLCGIQATANEIAQFLGIDPDTLAAACKRDHKLSFSDYFEQKRGVGRVSLRRAQWQAAQNGNPTMLIWLGKQHLEQRDKSSHELSGPDGKPMEHRDASHLSDADLDKRIAEMLAKVKP